MANNLDISTITGINQVGNSYQRKNPIPLDYYSFFNTRADAEEYAKTGAVAYVGQVIAFKESATDATVKVCVIKNEAGDLEALNNVEVKIPGVKQGTYITVTTDTNGDYTIAHANAATMTVTPETEKKTTFVTEITRDDQGHITGYKTATIEIPEVELDGVSINRTTDGKIQMKDFAEATTVEGNIPRVAVVNGTKTIEWVTVKEAVSDIKDENTVTTITAGNDGVEVDLISQTADEIKYEISHAAAPTEGDAATSEAGTQGTYITEVLIDEFGHVAGVKIAEDKDTTYAFESYEEAIDNNDSALGLIIQEDDETVHKFTIQGENGISVGDVNYQNKKEGITALKISAPDIGFTDGAGEYGGNSDTIPVLTGLEYIGINPEFPTDDHTLYIKRLHNEVPTKAYVDRLVSGATSYLGTVANEAQLKALNPEKGDFVRVSEPFNGYHASDMLICETPKAEGVDATWSLIHGEIDTDTDTWRANTKDADGYVKAPKDEDGNYLLNKVWKTDENGNPDWREDKDTTYTADEVSLTLDETEFSIKDSGVSTAKIADKAVTTAKIDDKAVTTAKIADKAVTSAQLSDAINASLANADSAVQPGDLTPVNDGKFTVSGTGYLTGSGEMTANQEGDTTATLDLTQATKDKIDNAMPKVPGATAGHYAMFDGDGKVVDGGYIASLTDALPTRDSEGTYEGQNGYLEFKIYEKLQDNDEQLLSYKLAVNKNSGLKLTQTDNSPYVSDENSLTPEQGASVYGELELSDATKASLAKADSAIQNILFTELAEPENDGCMALDDDSAQYSTGFRLEVHKGQGSDAEVTNYEFKLDTIPQDGIIFSPNESTAPSSGIDTAAFTRVSLAPWAKYRILNSVSEVDTTANQGLKTTTTYTYYDSTQEKEVTTTAQPGMDVVDFTKKTTLDIDESVTFILNCGSAADLL